ncbi:MAG: GGDEF domain-containing protein [Sphingomonadaceae bacterium]
MSYLDRSSHFDLKTRLRRMWSDEPAPRAEPALSWQERMFRDVGEFIFTNGLYPSPDNYDLAWQFTTAANAQLVAAIRDEIATVGSLSADAAERIFTASAGPISPDMLAKMAGEIESQVSGLTGMVRQSGDDAAEFGSALEEAPHDVARVLDLTRAMVARTRTAEAQLRTSMKELDGMRAHLAEAQHFADVDPLTELANRRAFKRQLEKAITAAHADGQPLALAFADIDHFKKLNDRHGHETGDRVLRFVAQLMTKHFAETGFVGRFGGEEFVVMFPGLDAQAACAAVDACREALVKLPLYSRTTGDRLGAVSFTAGVALLGAGEDIASLLRRADETLYRGKNEGRNRVLIA